MSNFIMSVRRRKLKNAHSSQRKSTVKQKKKPSGLQEFTQFEPIFWPFSDSVSTVTLSTLQMCVHTKKHIKCISQLKKTIVLNIMVPTMTDTNLK